MEKIVRINVFEKGSVSDQIIQCFKNVYTLYTDYPKDSVPAQSSEHASIAVAAAAKRQKIHSALIRVLDHGHTLFQPLPRSYMVGLPDIPLLFHIKPGKN